jgi:hypothetical protein
MAFNSFANRIPPGVPGQKDSMTPQNNEGLAVPWGQAMFSLPRSQMPGTTVGFNGGFGLDMTGDMQTAPGQSQTGMAPQPVGGVRFSLTRQASSDPVQNIINDIQNPLGGANLQFGGNAPAASPLKKSMVAGGGGGSGYDSQGFSPSGYDRSGRGYTGSVGNAPVGAISYSPELANMYGTGSPAMQQYMGANNPSNLPSNPNFHATGFGLRSRMTGFY